MEKFKEILAKSFMLLWGISLLLIVVAISLWVPNNLSTSLESKAKVNLPAIQSPQEPAKSEISQNTDQKEKKPILKKKIEYQEVEVPTDQEEENPTPRPKTPLKPAPQPQVPQPEPLPIQKPVSQAVVIITSLGNFPVEIKQGDTALDILVKAGKENNFEVKYTLYSFGAFITQIGNLAGDSSHYWAFYYNGQYSNVGASGQPIKEGDVTTWNYESF